MNFLGIGAGIAAIWYFFFRKPTAAQVVIDKVGTYEGGPTRVPGSTGTATDGDAGLQGKTSESGGTSGGGGTVGSTLPPPEPIYQQFASYSPPFYPGQVLTLPNSSPSTVQIISVGTGEVKPWPGLAGDFVELPIGTILFFPTLMPQQGPYRLFTGYEMKVTQI